MAEDVATKDESEIERKSSLKNKVSFDQNEASKAPKERISFEKPADLFVTAAPTETDTVTAETKDEQLPEASAQPVVETKPEPKVDASNTGTAKRKSKKKREEVGLSTSMSLLIFAWIYFSIVYVFID